MRLASLNALMICWIGVNDLIFGAAGARLFSFSISFSFFSVGRLTEG